MSLLSRHFWSLLLGSVLFVRPSFHFTNKCGKEFYLRQKKITHTMQVHTKLHKQNCVKYNNIINGFYYIC